VSVRKKKKKKETKKSLPLLKRRWAFQPETRSHSRLHCSDEYESCVDQNEAEPREDAVDLKFSIYRMRMSIVSDTDLPKSKRFEVSNREASWTCLVLQEIFELLLQKVAQDVVNADDVIPKMRMSRAPWVW
jgi:hypothetical protein